MCTKKNNLTTLLTTLLMVFVLGFTSCAKKLDEQVSEDIDRGVHSMAIFDETVEIQTVGKGTGNIVAMTANESELNFQDSAEAQGKKKTTLKLRKTNFIRGNKLLRVFFQGLKLESSKAGEIFKVQFELTDEFLIVKLLQEDHKFSPKLTAKIENGLVPLYQISISDFGILTRDQNDLGEDTRNVVFKSRNRDESSHVKISTSIEKRDFFGEDIELAGKVFANINKHFDTDAEYLYVPMTMGVPRAITESRPFHQGEEKLVKLKFTKAGLQVFQIEKDSRFTGNDLNHHPVLTIPGEYKDFRCKRDKEGKCKDGSSANNDLEFDKKTYFLPEFEKLTINEVNELDLFGPDAEGCVSETGAPRVVDYLVKKGVINIKLERTYRISTQWHCAAGKYFSDKLYAAGFKVQYFYSMAKLDKLASQNYEAVDYPLPDHDSFGYFKTTDESLDDINDHSRTKTKYFLQRWNPKKKVIHYHLSDTYAKPVNKMYKDATYSSVETINRTLRDAKAGIQIKLHEPSGKNPGDLRYNTIVLIDDPVNTGLLGYAPSVANPKTGEIVQGHVNMYSGVLRSLSRRVYEEMVDLTESQLKASKDGGDKSLINIMNSPSSLGSNFDFDERILTRLKKAPKSILPQSNSFVLTEKSEDYTSLIESKQALAFHKEKKRLHAKPDLRRQGEELSKMDEYVLNEDKRLNYFAKHNIFAEEFFSIAGTAKAVVHGIKKLDNILKADGTLKRWKDLKADQRAKAADLISIHGYSSTLVHEFGHNLGLRHNFTGSFDAANFYTKKEAKELGLKDVPAYSSVMDYAGSSLNELTIFGKYDRAALRFGYAREVELDNGKFIKVKSTMEKLIVELDEKSLNMKDYSFCTDQNASLSASCRRFDEGTTLVEVVQHYIHRYERGYKYRNFRNERNQFQDSDLRSYSRSRIREFNKIRDVFEEWEFFAEIFGEGIMANGCSPAQTRDIPICKRINDRVAAVKLVYGFFLKILKTPDHTCAIAKADAPTVISRLMPLAEIYEEIKYGINYVPASCFDPAVKEFLAEMKDDERKADAHVIISEAGKFLNGFKDNNEYYPYSNDRYALGIWVDKLLAIKALYKRKNARRLTEKKHMALVDHAEVSPLVGNFLRHIVMGEDLENPVPFTKEDGTQHMLKYSLDNSYVINGPNQYLTRLKGYYNLPESGKSLLNQKILEQIGKWSLTNDEDYKEQSRALLNYASVRKRDIETPFENEDILSYLLNGDDVIYGATDDNGMASDMIKAIKSHEFLAEVKVEDIKQNIEDRVNPAIPAGLDELQTIVIKMELSLINGLINAKKGGVAELDRDFLVNSFGEETADKILKVYPVMTVEDFEKVKELKIKMTQAPDLATDLIKKLYAIDIADLKKFLSGEMDAQVQLYIQNLQILPLHTKRVNTGGETVNINIF